MTLTDWRDVLLWALWVVIAAALIVFTIWFTSACSRAHGGHWWCWLG